MMREPAGEAPAGGRNDASTGGYRRPVTRSSSPRVLIPREVGVGHAARSVSRIVALAVDQIAFLARSTGLDLTGLGQP